MTESSEPKYRRILLKISGEFMRGNEPFGLDMPTFDRVAQEIREVQALGVSVGIVIGAGNIFRGAQALNLNRASADYIGMVATMINALLLQAALENLGVDTRVQTAIDMQEVAEPYIRRRAIRHLEKGRVVIFGSGTGNPYFTTDTAAALRANEIEANVLMKATNVDGIYTSDPRKDSNAKRLSHISFQEVVRDDLRVMDTSAVSLCRDNQLPILVFNLSVPGNILRSVKGEQIGTLVDGKES